MERRQTFLRLHPSTFFLLLVLVLLRYKLSFIFVSRNETTGNRQTQTCGFNGHDKVEREHI